jgi:hypothetical protein
MKIIEDKVTVYPPHAICQADVRLIMSTLPLAWTEGIMTVRLSAALSPLRIALKRGQTFTISSRGRNKSYTLNKILLELAANGMGITYARWHRIQARDLAVLEKVVNPLADELLPQLSRKKIWLDHGAKHKD